jgi:hypothetical protein
MINKNDRIMMIDTETTNDLDCPIVYDVGFQVFDLNGNTFASDSLINADVFLDSDLMASAFFADKIPHYWEAINGGLCRLAKWSTIKKIVREVATAFDVKIACAHNAVFDYRALNTTQRYITTSKNRYFLPYGIEWWDTLKMARAILKDNDDYAEFCFDNGFFTERGARRYTAEVIYRYLTQNVDFEESHTGLSDVMIERKIFEYCLTTDPSIDGRLWKPKDEITA